MTDDTWTETGLNWNNQPGSSGVVIASASGYSVGQSKSINITGAVTGEAAGDGTLSLRVTNPNPSFMFVGFHSKEAALSNLRPVLEVVFAGLAPPAPAAPEGLVGSAGSSTQIDLAWSAPAGAASYNIRRSFESGGPYTLIAAGVQGTQYSDIGLAPGTTYYYTVSAVNGAGESPQSVAAFAIPGDAFQESGGVLSMEAENGVLGSRWMTVADATASNGARIEINPAYNHTGSTPASTAPESLVTYEFDVSTSGNYRFWFRAVAPSADDDSFFWRIDNGDWVLENNRGGIGAWHSTDNVQVNGLAAGSHVLEIAYRENETGLDKFVIQLDSLTAPIGTGPAESSRGHSNGLGGTSALAAAVGAAADNAQPLYGPSHLIEWTLAVPYPQVEAMKDLGINAEGPMAIAASRGSLDQRTIDPRAASGSLRQASARVEFGHDEAEGHDDPSDGVPGYDAEGWLEELATDVASVW